MQKIFFLFGLLFLLWACFNSKGDNKFSVSEVTPQIVDPEGGSIITIKGKKLSSVTSIWIGGVNAEKLEIISDENIKVWSSALPAGAKYPIRIMYANDEIILNNAIESWSPSLIEGAIIFDAKFGINAEASGSTYE